MSDGGTLRVHRSQVPEGFEWVVPVDGRDVDMLHLREDRPDAPWAPMRVEVLRDRVRGRRPRRSDMPWLSGGVLVLRDEAVDVVGPLLEPYGELLPMICDEARLAVFFARTLAGVLDESRSEFVSFEPGRIGYLPGPVFHTEALTGRLAFRLAEMPRGELFLTEPLVDALRATGLTAGTDFPVVYDGAGRGLPDRPVVHPPVVFRKHWFRDRVTSSRGYSVSLSRDAVTYEDAGGTVRIDAEWAPARRPWILLFAASVPEPEGRTRGDVVADITRACHAAGWRLSVR